MIVMKAYTSYITNVLPYPIKTIVINTKDFNHGHVSLTTAFTMEGNPKDNAAKIANQLENNEYVERIELAGPYVNLWMNDKFYFDYLYFVPEKSKKNKKIMVEFPSANPNKPLHLGHLRNMILGDTISNLYEYLGYEVIRVNYINDMGLQVAELLWDYIKNQPSEEEKRKIDYYLGERYVKISELMENDEVKKEVTEVLRQLEEGNNKIATMGREMTELCVKRHHQTMFRFNIYHHYDIFESDIVHHLYDEGMKKIKNCANVYIAENELKGCHVIKLEGEEFKKLKNTEKVLIRSNGVLTYTGKDVIFHLWKLGVLNKDIPIKEWFTQPNGEKLKYSKDGGMLKCPKCDIIINVIGREQELEQKVVRYVLSKVLTDDSLNERYYHMSYGLVRLKGSKFSGRKGTWKGYAVDDVLDEGIEKAKEVLKLFGYEGDDKTSTAMAISAIRFSMLKYAPQKDFDFEWDKALTFEGDSAPYIQYAYVRCLGILRNAKDKEHEKVESYEFNDDEKMIINNLINMDHVILSAARQFKPNDLITYMLNLVPVFNRFYDRCRIIDNDKVNPVRLRIVEKTVETLGTLMDMCGIIKLEKM